MVWLFTPFFVRIGAPFLSLTQHPRDIMDSIAAADSHALVRILLAEDQAIVRRGIASLLRLTPGFEIVAEAENGVQAVEFTQQCLPDMVLMDIGMPLMNGVEAAAKIKATNKNIKIIMLTAYDSDDFVMNTIASGADGYVLKNATPDSLSAAVTSSAPPAERRSRPALAAP